MWVDKTLYWAWHSLEKPPSPPTKRWLDYAIIEGDQYKMRIACTVYNDGIPSFVCRDEIEWHKQLGAKVCIPPVRKV